MFNLVGIMKSTQRINVFTLTMITSAFVMSIRNLPTLSVSGLHIIFFCLLAAIGFVFPLALVSAELASGWPKEGGVYAWVKEAFGERLGFLAIWLQWVENLVWFPTALSFAGSTLAYFFFPELSNNKYFLIAFILIVYWGTTLLNLKGMKISGRISTVCVIVGSIIPTIFLVVLCIIYLKNGKPIQLDFHGGFKSYFPNMSEMRNIVIFLSFAFSFSGLEASAVHVNVVENPQRNYPLAIFFTSLLLIVTYITGSLAISMVVPQDKISLVAGVVEAFEIFLKEFNLVYILPLVAVLVTTGILGQVSTWIVGPSKGLLVTAKNKDLPKILLKENKMNMPVNIMYLQGIIVTIAALMFLFMPSVNSSFWILLTLTSIIYLIMYVLLFLAGIKLRYSQPNVVRKYRVPGKNWGMWIVGSLGLVVSIFTIIIGFVPPSQIETGSLVFYEVFLISGVVILLLVPMIIFDFEKFLSKKTRR